MSMLNNIANEMLYTNLAQAALRVSAGILGLEHLRVAVLGENDQPRFVYDVLASNQKPSFAIDLYTRESTAYTKAYTDFNPQMYDCILTLGRNSFEEAEIRGMLAQVPLGRAAGKLCMDWNCFSNAAFSVLGRLQPLPTCLSYQKLLAIAAAVYYTENSTSIVECGVFKGGTTVFMGMLLAALGRNNPIFALDTYGGLPAPTQKDIDGGNHYPVGFFSETSLESVLALYRSSGLEGRIMAVPGLVGDTLPEVLRSSGQPCGFAFIDLDQYQGIYDAISALTAYQPNLFALIDDTSLAGVDQAIGEASQSRNAKRLNLGFNLDSLSIQGPAPLSGQYRLSVQSISNALS